MGWNPADWLCGLGEVLVCSEPQPPPLAQEEKRTALATSLCGVLCGVKGTPNIKQHPVNDRRHDPPRPSRETLNPLGGSDAFYMGPAWTTDATLSQGTWILFLRSGKSEVRTRPETCAAAGAQEDSRGPGPQPAA